MKKVILGLFAAFAMFGLTTFTSLAATGTVTGSGVSIREKPSTDSNKVGTATSGKEIEIFSTEKDSSGNTWYKVQITGGSFGYIRSDFIKSNDAPAAQAAATAAPAATTAPAESKPEATVPTAIGEQQATIKSENNVNIRSGASTKHDRVVSLPNGTAITLIGEANDTAGNKWYQLKCDYNGKSYEGYIRSDLIAIGSTGETTQTAAGETTTEGGESTDPNGELTGETPLEGEEPHEEAEPEPTPEPEEEHNDYDVVYAQDDAGEYFYYLYNNLEGNRQKVDDLLSVVQQANDNLSKLQADASRSKIIIIAMAVGIVILFVVITILIIKLRGAYEYEYEEEEEEEEEPPVKKKRQKSTSEEEDDDEAPRRSSKREKQYDEDVPVKTRKSQSSEGTAKKSQGHKAQNFLADDDEFEFEFLNMDDKDL